MNTAPKHYWISRRITLDLGSGPPHEMQTAPILIQGCDPIDAIKAHETTVRRRFEESQLKILSFDSLIVCHEAPFAFAA